MDGDTLFAYSAACGLFASVFRPGIAPDLLRRCAESHVIATWPFEPASPAGQAALASLGEVFADLGEPELAGIERDNAVLFVGPEDPVPLWESVWTTRERLLFGACTEAVRQAFARDGFEPPNADREPADHLSLELAFLAALFARAGRALESGDTADAERQERTAATFLAEHPARWAPQCLDEIGRRAASPFYRAASALCADTLAGLERALAPPH